jgi:hypothetical protein
MDVQGVVKGEPSFRTASILALVVAGAVLVVVTYVQHGHAPGWTEIAIRTCASISGLLAVTILLFLGFRSWIRTSRVKLPAWRNGLGLSSMVLVSLVWMVPFVTSTASVVRPPSNHLFGVDPLSWLATLLYSNLFAGLIAIARTGRSRLLVLCSALLIWSSLQSRIYF